MSVGSITVVIPAPPETVNVSVAKLIVFEPVSADIFKDVAMLTLAA